MAIATSAITITCSIFAFTIGSNALFGKIFTMVSIKLGASAASYSSPDVASWWKNPLQRFAITRPISRLADFTQEITESGKFENQRITMKTGDEIEALSDSFNFMMEELENYIANLSKVTAEKERIGTELDIARNIQASMLPCIFPAFPSSSSVQKGIPATRLTPKFSI